MKTKGAKRAKTYENVLLEAGVKDEDHVLEKWRKK
jgi:hypothetical protein